MVAERQHVDELLETVVDDFVVIVFAVVAEVVAAMDEASP